MIKVITDRVVMLLWSI